MFSHSSKVDLVDAAVEAGYDVVLHVVMIPLVLSGPRVSARVDAGGHDVPVDKLASRYERIWPLVVASTPACRRAVFYDNAADDGPQIVASYRYGTADHATRWPTWTPSPLLDL